MQKIIHPLLLIFSAVLMSGCSSNKVNKVIELAGDNASELQAVLLHYKDVPEKYDAALFIIENMYNHYGYDSSARSVMQPIYEEHRRISEAYGWTREIEWQNSIDSIWKPVKSQYLSRMPKYSYDLQIIKADWLIKQIDMAFKAWQENAYTANQPFEEFCQYILPYRADDGICLDDYREKFYERHKGYFKDTAIQITTALDSLLRKYSNIKHSVFSAIGMPIVNAGAMEQVQRAICNEKGWFNIHLLRALGLNAAMDFVPAWANRSAAHSWNVVIHNGQTIAFDPFWEEKDRYKYKRIYNNVDFDILWGDFRLPKVYRNTYEHYIIGPIADKSIKHNNIPPLFRNTNKKDVSHEYFDTTDVELILSDNKSEEKYCYLCVYCSNQGWTPVQWGKIENNKSVKFIGMGRDIVYLPMYYNYGSLTQAAPMLYISSSGDVKPIPIISSQDTTSIALKAYTSDISTSSVLDSRKALSGGLILAWNNHNPNNPDTIYQINDTINMWRNNIPVQSTTKYQYFAFKQPQIAIDTFSCCEFSFIEQKTGQRVNAKVSGNVRQILQAESLQRISDGLSATGFKGVYTDKSKMVLFDFGKPQAISNILMTPYNQGSYLLPETTYSLDYWNNGWIKFGKTQCDDSGVVTFNGVPKSTIYRLVGPHPNNRIFAYYDGFVYWL